MDVDIIVEVGTRGEFVALQEQLRHRGFSEDMSEDSSICRWKCEDVLVDVMPTEERMLGFSNRWYPLASRIAEQLDIGQSTVIRVISAPCFLATKIEAFLDRGKGDYIVSHDLEDVIAVIDGRDPLLAEVERGDAAVRRYLAHEFRRMLSEGAFLDAVAGHLPSDSASQRRLPLVLERVRRIADLSG